MTLWVLTKACRTAARSSAPCALFESDARPFPGTVEEWKAPETAGNLRGARLPGADGIPISNRLSPLQLAALSNARGVEFAVVYKAGAGPNGAGGRYWLYSGVKSAVS